MFDRLLNTPLEIYIVYYKNNNNLLSNLSIDYDLMCQRP